MLAFTPSDAANVGRLLEELHHAASVPARIRDAAGYWADEVNPDMPPEDVQTVAWLLQDAGMYQGMPPERRERARYWAALLDGVG